MKYYTRKYLLLLLIFWLPAQGIAAAFAPHCTYQSNGGQELNTSNNFIIDDYLHNVDHKQPMDGNMTSNQRCEVDTLCHASCSVLFATTHSTIIPISDHSIHESLNTIAPSFIPDLLQRPPRA